ncbi:hypothetical protein AKJ09_10714 [Labilithrix luteola]|uniref:Uncharacterized protein n=1 Tax=Labilithrix luteola TaxID=1391654 RepID=A0A0K1QE54_9BACT|nr:hypothetical protein [Labilithrix luteola]AKV04051.1 hypothetical protein AKJ09_10714 [Labilithrix luteola]
MTTPSSSHRNITHRIYVETLPYDALVRPSTVALLRCYALDVVVAVRPWQMRELPPVVRILRDAGLRVSVWPMLADDDGRWANARNATAFATMVRAVCHALDAEKSPASEILFDLEPPFGEAQALTVATDSKRPLTVSRVRSSVVALAEGAIAPLRPSARRSFERAKAILANTVRELGDRDMRVSSAVWPLVALDRPAHDTWQSLLGTPVDALVMDRVSVMLYTTIFEGWSRGTVRRRDALALLAAACDRTVRRFGARAGISLGCVGTGAFEDEPVYRSPEELAVDAAVARASGCTELSLFDLGGVLSRGPAEAWLDAFTSPNLEPVVLQTARVFAARRMARMATWALALR